MTEFLSGFVSGFFASIMLFLAIIYRPEIKSWLSDKWEWINVKWILWKYR